MDDRRFDALTRMLARTWSRRGAAGLAVGALASGAGVRDVGAGPEPCTPDGERCRPRQASCELCCSNCNVKKRHNGHHRFICGPQARPCDHRHRCCPGFICDAGTCMPIPSSDRALKTDIAQVDPGAVLAQVATLPIATWSYTNDDPAIRHIGPMAQDFAAAFGVGANDLTIHPIDGQGVALAAIQALHGMAQALQADNVALRARLDALERGRDGGAAI